MARPKNATAARPMKAAELQDWTYLGEPLVPLKGYPGVVWERPAKKKRRQVIRGQKPGFPAPDDHDE